MAETTSIEWTTDPVSGRPGATWSPVTGCTDADPSCKFCYAKRLSATRLRKQPKYRGVAEVGKNGPQWSGAVLTHPEILDQPLGWRGRRRIFVCSMSDLFHERVPFDFIAQVWAAMWFSYQHRGHHHLCLTKRTKRARGLLSGEILGDQRIETFREAVQRHINGRFVAGDRWGRFSQTTSVLDWPVQGIHLGMSAGRQEEADERWRDLSHTPIQASFMSIEPMIGPVDLYEVLANPLAAAVAPDQVIGGGESGTRRRCRPPHPAWGSDLMAACDALGIPGFWKQWGNWRPGSCGDHDRELVVLRDGTTYTHAQIAGDDIEERHGAREPWRNCRDVRHRGSEGGWAHHLRLDPSVMSFGTKKEAGRQIAGKTFDGYPQVCSSCYEPLQAWQDTSGCPFCEGTVCSECAVYVMWRGTPLGMCLGCRKDLELAPSQFSERRHEVATT